MNMLKITIIFYALSLFNFQALACDMDGKTGIVEENDMWIGVDDKLSRNGMTKEEYNSVVTKIEALYAPIFREAKKTLRISRSWKDGTVNAYAKLDGSIAHVVIMGGLARHPEINQDSLALVMCHEAGHHIGGLPKKKVGGTFSTVSWASNEGQADYYGTMKCLRRYFEGEDNVAALAGQNIPQHVAEECNSRFTLLDDQAVCQRSVMAGYSLARMFRALRTSRNISIPELTFAAKDPSIVTKTFDNHPKPQCRLDTYFSAALCDKDVRDRVSYQDINKGLCATEEGHRKGARPLCWYKAPI